MCTVCVCVCVSQPNATVIDSMAEIDSQLSSVWLQCCVVFSHERDSDSAADLDQLEELTTSLCHTDNEATDEGERGHAAPLTILLAAFENVSVSDLGVGPGNLSSQSVTLVTLHYVTLVLV